MGQQTPEPTESERFINVFSKKISQNTAICGKMCVYPCESAHKEPDRKQAAKRRR
jgi:hypothetical protein